MTLDQLTVAKEPTDSGAPFKLENNYTLDVTVDGSLLAKAGSMIAYTGELSFSGKGSAEGGITGILKEAATGEGTPIMVIEGQGHAYLADSEKKIQLLELGAEDSITVNGEDILAFESHHSYEITSMDTLAGAFAGGFTNVRLEGPGYAAITTHGDPIVLEPPVATDPSATVGWSGTSPTVNVNKNLADMVGQESGERFQMNFQESGGSVIVQPDEEHAGQQ